LYTDKKLGCLRVLCVLIFKIFFDLNYIKIILFIYLFLTLTYQNNIKILIQINFFL
jgi:hypothetical protein